MTPHADRHQQFSFYRSAAHRDLHSFPTRRSSDLVAAAAELGAQGITVNVVNPGPTDTGWISAELNERIRRATPLGRVGRPEDAAQLVAFLCSPRGSWITGQILVCDGGASVAPTLREGRRPLE